MIVFLSPWADPGQSPARHPVPRLAVKSSGETGSTKGMFQSFNADVNMPAREHVASSLIIHLLFQVQRALCHFGTREATKGWQSSHSKRCYASPEPAACRGSEAPEIEWINAGLHQEPQGKTSCTHLDAVCLKRKNSKMKWAFNMTAGWQVRAARREDEAEGRAGEAGADAQGRQRSSCPSTVPSAPCCRRCPAAVPPGGGVCSRWQVRPIRQLPAAGRVLAVDTADVPWHIQGPRALAARRVIIRDDGVTVCGLMMRLLVLEVARGLEEWPNHAWRKNFRCWSCNSFYACVMDNDQMTGCTDSGGHCLLENAKVMEVTLLNQEV
jgi:hypothetical protein